MPFIAALSVSAVNAADLINKATATGTPPTGPSVTSAESTVAIPVVTKAPAYRVVKTITSTTTSAGGSATQVDGGDTITYQYQVINTGNVNLNTVTLTDPGVSFNGGAANALTSGPTKVSGDTVAPGILNVGETWTYTATYQLTQANVDASAGVTNGVSNTVSSSAKDQQTITVNPAPTSVLTATTTIPKVATLDILKTANTSGPLTVGQTVVFNYLVTNKGNVSLTGVGVNETLFNGTGGTGALTPVVTPAGASTTLAPGGTVNFTASYVVTQADIDALQ